MRRSLIVCGVFVFAVSCGGNKPSPPSGPSGSSTSTTTTSLPPPPVWSVAGVLTTFQDGQPLGGVNVSTPGATQSSTTDNGGRYRLGGDGPNPTFTPYLVTFEHPTIFDERSPQDVGAHRADARR